ncbi:hypothetical protein [Desulforamulus hydrothermalis]|uniref:Putative NEDD8-activating enzyme E1 regulatory subunit n=1 Tax=Desulforamulus hydrothermalis Lam5 = DSM 18033 TaxID=1121428 RepID=K8EBK4_9FIRM|nr:hypothetical protein [Desulforamulus hydrothermalis]CCO09043.1 putative NEDD8-activating enzyme E1 regulatory subunit [Desulforamulus hydrothermalis Lam5 = DSM 18033]SHG77708.1 hypothetical protein SAMN02745177_00359 [Desulforamulus hydrothermalis Lam5 = DSM 18033]
MKYRLNVIEAINRFREFNLSVAPVPGTSKYCISFPEGRSTLLKEKMLIEIAGKLKGEQASEIFQHLQASAR